MLFLWGVLWVEHYGRKPAGAHFVGIQLMSERREMVWNFSFGLKLSRIIIWKDTRNFHRLQQGPGTGGSKAPGGVQHKGASVPPQPMYPSWEFDFRHLLLTYCHISTFTPLCSRGDKNIFLCAPTEQFHCWVPDSKWKHNDLFRLKLVHPAPSLEQQTLYQQPDKGKKEQIL